MPYPMPKHISAAKATPSHTLGISRECPDCFKKPATMPTIKAASIPSRNIIKKAINIYKTNLKTKYPKLNHLFFYPSRFTRRLIYPIRLQ